MKRYHNQIILSEIGIIGQNILKKARILIVGAGGLSATLLPQLIGAGVGYIRIYDKDMVKLHNLHRQTLFTMKDIGQPKVFCVKNRFKDSNPDVKIETVCQSITVSNVKLALSSINVVIDAADNFCVTYLLSDVCSVFKIPLISASVMGRKGYVGGFCCSAPSYRAVFPNVFMFSSGNCQNNGVMGAVVSVLGALQAQMCLSVLLGLLPSVLGCIINCDFVNWYFYSFRFDNAKEPEGKQVSFIDHKSLSIYDYIIELRSIEEHYVRNVRINVHRITLEQLVDYNFPKDQRIVLVCRSGIRASHAAKILLERGYQQLAILMGDGDN